MIDGGNVIYRSQKTAAEINDGEWHSVVVTRTLMSEVRIYIDGVLSGSDDDEGAPGPITGMTFIGVGNSPCNVSMNVRWFPGEVDDLRFYDRILSADEALEFNTPPSPPSSCAAARTTTAPALQPWMLLGLAIAVMALGYTTLRRKSERQPI
jgi:hypothetical protein